MAAKPRGAEVTSITEAGFTVRADGRELFVAFDQFPWFRHARVSDLFDVELAGPEHLHWPAIDADLSFRAIERPEEYPLVARCHRVEEPRPTYDAKRPAGVRLRIDVPHEAIASFCRKRGIRRLAFFGSVVRDDFTPESDVDVLVEFEPERVPSLFKLVHYQDELSELFGRRVDLCTFGGLDS